MFVLPPAGPRVSCQTAHMTERAIIETRIADAHRWKRKRSRLLWALRLGLRRGTRVRECLDGGSPSYYPSHGFGARMWQWLGRSVRLKT